jgi:hypothetical protein
MESKSFKKSQHDDDTAIIIRSSNDFSFDIIIILSLVSSYDYDKHGFLVGLDDRKIVVPSIQCCDNNDETTPPFSGHAMVSWATIVVCEC